MCCLSSINRSLWIYVRNLCFRLTTFLIPHKITLKSHMTLPKGNEGKKTPCPPEESRRLLQAGGDTAG